MLANYKTPLDEMGSMIYAPVQVQFQILAKRSNSTP